jgi:hypothetical protein
MLDQITAISALISIIISIIALLVAKSGADKSTLIASEALKTARQSNDIALGSMRESPVVEIFSSDDYLDFTSTDLLKEDLKVKISIRNSGKVAIDGLLMEIIGIEPFTFPDHNPDNVIRPLPSIRVDAGIETMIQPDGLAHIDMRIPILRYLVKLEKLIDERSDTYRTAINVVLMPKAIGDTMPSGVLTKYTMKDRRLINVHFDPAILSTNTVKDLLANEAIGHRVYSP